MAINRATLAKEVDGTIEYIYPKSTADMIDYKEGDIIRTVEDKLNALDDAIANIDISEALEPYYTKTEVDDLLYEPIEIGNVTISPTVAEVGDTPNVTVSWAINKVPSELTVDGNSIVPPVKDGSTVINGIGTTKAITVVAKDEGTSAGNPATSSKSATIKFYHPLYSGVATLQDSINSDFILQLGSLKTYIQGNINCNFTVNAGNGQYIWFACPATNSPNFSVGGFSGGFELVETFDFTNSHGEIAQYKVYRSQNAALGKTTVVVS